MHFILTQYFGFIVSLILLNSFQVRDRLWIKDVNNSTRQGIDHIQITLKISKLNTIY